MALSSRSLPSHATSSRSTISIPSRCSRFSYRTERSSRTLAGDAPHSLTPVPVQPVCRHSGRAVATRPRGSLANPRAAATLPARVRARCSGRSAPDLPHAGPPRPVRAVRPARTNRPANLALAGHPSRHGTRRLPGDHRRRLREQSRLAPGEGESAEPGVAEPSGLEVPPGPVAKPLGGGVVLSRRALVGRTQGAAQEASALVRRCGWQIHHHVCGAFALVG